MQLAAGGSSEGKGQSPASKLSAPTSWLWGASALTFPLLVLTPLVVLRLGEQAALLFPALALLCNYPHYAATWLRLWALMKQGVEPQLRTQLLHATCVLGLLTTLYFPSLLAPFLTLYLLWSPWHYAGQNYGLTLYFLHRKARGLTQAEQRLLRMSFMASTLIPALFLMRAGGEAPGLLSLSLSAWLTSSLGLAALLVQLYASMRALARVTVQASLEQRLHEVLPSLLLVVVQLLWFSSLLLPLLGKRLPFLPAQLGTGEIAFLHCAQYLWLTAQLHAAVSHGQPRPAHAEWERYFKLFAVGALLWLALPWGMSRGLSADYQHAVMVTTVWVNLHHFVLDGWIWKLRDVRVREALGLEASALPHPTAGSDESRRYSRLWGVFAFLMLLLAGTDLFYRKGLLTPDDATLRARLLQLNPSSATLLSYEGMAQLEHGHRQEALHTFRQALKLQPLDAAAWHNLAMLLKEEQPLLAIQHFERATELAPQLHAAQLQLGILYAQQQDPRARATLELATHSPSHRIEAQRWLVQLEQAEKALE